MLVILHLDHLLNILILVMTVMHFDYIFIVQKSVRPWLNQIQFEIFVIIGLQMP